MPTCRLLLLVTVLVGSLSVPPGGAAGLGVVLHDREVTLSMPETLHETAWGLTVTGVGSVGNRHAWELTWMDLAKDGSLLREGHFGLGQNLHLRWHESIVTSTDDLVVAWADEFGSGGSETGHLHVTCLDAARELRWSWSFHAGAAEVWNRARGLVELPGGDLLVTSWSDGLLLIRLSAEDGRLLTTRRLDTSNAGSVLTETGEILIAGYHDGHLALLSLSPALEVNWQRRYVTPARPSLRTVVARPGGGALLAGDTLEYDFGSHDAWAMAVDATGAVEWQRVFGRDRPDRVNSAVVLPDGGFLLGGDSSVGFDRPDAWLLFLEPDGSIRRELRHGTDLTEYVESMALLEDGRLALAVRTNEIGSTSAWDTAVYFLDESGGLPDSCPPLTSFDSLSAALDMVAVSVPGPVAELPITVSPFVNYPVLSVTPSVEIRSCWESTVSEPPTEVSPPGTIAPLRVDAGSLLSWEPGALSSSTGFNLYRGVLSELVPGSRPTCLAAGLTDTTTTDGEPPPPGTGWFYLVSGVNDLGEGPLGHDSVGAARTAATACP